MLLARDFFEIKSLQIIKSIPDQEFSRHKEDSKAIFLQVAVLTRGRVRSDALYAKAYYYGESRELIDKADKPYPIERGTRQRYEMPVFFDNRNIQYVYFRVPDKVLQEKGCRIVVVFGDEHEAAGSIFLVRFLSSLREYKFPEHSKVFAPEDVKRDGIENPVYEYVLKTESKNQPQITILLRAPVGIADMSEANGVLAMCLLANDFGEIKRRLQEIDAADEVGGILRFAQEHKLVVLCWGSKQLWNPRLNWDDVDNVRDKLKGVEFDHIASAWAKGIEEITKRHRIPNRDFLLWGCSGSAQYAMRLALRQPKYFLAVHIHVPSSFDEPTPEARRIMWCLTTGDNEVGYERSLRFYAACRILKYPIIYKAVIGLGHSRNRLADELGLAFFEYALLERAKNKRIAPYQNQFDNVEFVGDIVNQEVHPIEDIHLVPEAYRTMLPTRKLADKWRG